MAVPAARVANISPATMSAHLGKLVAGGLLKVDSQGKHRYYLLAGPKVGALLETFGTLVPLPASPVKSRSGPAGTMRFARTCYRHIAGQLAVEFNLAAQKRGLWSPSDGKEYRLTKKGRQWLAELGVETNGAHGKSGFARACLDWSERKHHVSGVLGTLLLDRFLALKWIARISGSRGLRLTLEGRAKLSQLLDLQVPR